MYFEKEQGLFSFKNRTYAVFLI